MTRKRSEKQRLQAAIRQRVSRILREWPALRPIRLAVHDYVEADAACATLFAHTEAHPEDAVMYDRYLAQQLERRHARSTLMRYLPPAPDPESWDDDECILE